MADGITASGSGATRQIMYQNDAAAPNGLWYTEVDFYNAFPADFVLVAPDTYQAKCFIQNGDGVGSAKTTWKGTKSVIKFDPGFTVRTHATGRVNRWYDWGTLTQDPFTSPAIYGENPVGYDGLVVHFAASTTIDGNFKLYGCDLRNYQTGTAGRIFLAPGVAGTFADVVDTDVLASNTMQYGNGTKSIDRLRRLTSVNLGAGSAGRIIQFNVDDGDTVTIAAPFADYMIKTGGRIKCANMRFIGPTTTAEAHNNTNATLLRQPAWSRQCQKGLFVMTHEWFELNTIVLGSDDAPLAGVLVELVDKYDGRTLATARTLADGSIDYTSLNTIQEIFGSIATPYQNAVCAYAPVVVSPALVTTQEELGPWLLKINRDRAFPQYASMEQIVRLPVESWTADSVTVKEWRGVVVTIKLLPPNATSDETFYGYSEIDTMLAEFGQDVSVAGVTVKGIVERRNVEVLEGEGFGVAQEVIVTLKTGSLQGLGVGVAFNADGESFYVMEMKQTGDGAVTEVHLAKD